jgi:hypothetical protein
MNDGQCLFWTQVTVSLTLITLGTSEIILSHGIPSPLLGIGVLTVLSGIPGCSPPLWAFAVPLF